MYEMLMEPVADVVEGLATKVTDCDLANHLGLIATVTYQLLGAWWHQEAKFYPMLHKWASPNGKLQAIKKASLFQ